MKVAIIEDESLAAKRLESLLIKCDDSITVEAVLPSVKESVKWLSTHPQPDLLFMDIHLDDGQSFAIFDQVECFTPVVFTTAYDDYMIKAFKVNSIDYLLKPINPEELQASIAKFKKLRTTSGINSGFIKELLHSALPKEPAYKSRFLITQGSKIRTIDIADVAYFYSEEKLTFLVTKEGQRLPVDYTLEKLFNILDPKYFFRISRQFIIHLESIDTIHKYSPTRLKVELRPATTKDAFVSIEKYTAFKEWLDA
ncbi:LytR/AlgR family response regulator transcription factor [Pontibacter fetidus]|uniref:Response regulator transcription factor n=1 Tax=Pontibacter fetidus TaxID=2700082 RepID=A0A6B2H750_9BACT|nr:LytTR family DNA-binding domain-containing protein [Pontibacter fetidus]NDK55740.1 response regulator transcription factor [Pontibacter fetidus]